MWHPALSGCTTKKKTGTLSSDEVATVNLAAEFTHGNVVAFEIHNTHATGDLFWDGQGETAVTTTKAIAAGESSGFLPGQDKTISLIREAGVAVTYEIWIFGR